MMGKALGHDSAALKDLDTALLLFRPLVEQDRGNRIWQFEVAAIEQDRLVLLTRTVGSSALLARLTRIQRTFQDLLEYDSKNAAWARREALARVRLAAALPAGTPLQHTMLTTAVSDLQALHHANRRDLSGKLALVESLLHSASTQQAVDMKAPLLHCQLAHEIIGNDVIATNDYTVLEFWVRTNLCLHAGSPAQAAIGRLRDIGYHDSEYLKFISNQSHSNSHPPKDKI